jgi:hypothetical protein
MTTTADTGRSTYVTFGLMTARTAAFRVHPVELATKIDASTIGFVL